MSPEQPTESFTPYQKFVIAVLAFLQFTIILDFMILSPLGAILMPALNITPAQFGWVVSVYAFSAGASGVLAAGFADRFDRKSLLLFFYSGFLVGTLLCGMAPNYPFLVAARMITGLFGGVLGAVVFAITTDLFPLQMRGRVMGILQTAFAASQVLGIPIGLWIATRWGWHSAFLMIVGLGTVAGAVISLKLKPLRGHLAGKVDKNPFHHLIHTLSTVRYLKAYSATALLSIGGFMIMPFSSAFTVHNLHIDAKDLPWIYVFTGIASILAGPAVGKLADTIGKYKVFLTGSLAGMVMVIIYTHLSPLPLPALIFVVMLMFVTVSTRIISSSAMISAIPSPHDRGSFMSLNSSIQQVSGGVATALAGMIVTQQADGSIGHFDRLGFVVVAAQLITVIMMWKIQHMIATPPSAAASQTA